MTYEITRVICEHDKPSVADIEQDMRRGIAFKIAEDLPLGLTFAIELTRSERPPTIPMPDAIEVRYSLRTKAINPNLFKEEDLLYRFARHVWNTDKLSPTAWAVAGMDLLFALRELHPAKYNHLVQDRSAE